VAILVNQDKNQAGIWFLTGESINWEDEDLLLKRGRLEVQQKAGNL